MYTCIQLVQDVADMNDGSKKSEVLIHKEEKSSRIRSDSCHAEAGCRNQSNRDSDNAEGDDEEVTMEDI